MELNNIEGNSTVIVKHLLPLIESHRAEGYKMTQIYEALPDKIKGKIPLGTFRNTYYRVRPKVDASPVSVASNVPGSNPVSEASVEQPLSSLGKTAQPSASKSKKPRRMIDLSQSLEEHQAIARADFNRE